MERQRVRKLCRILMGYTGSRKGTQGGQVCTYPVGTLAEHHTGTLPRHEMQNQNVNRRFDGVISPKECSFCHPGEKPRSEKLLSEGVTANKRQGSLTRATQRIFPVPAYASGPGYTLLLRGVVSDLYLTA